jgi:hypothetical protein
MQSYDKQFRVRGNSWSGLNLGTQVEFAASEWQTPICEKPFLKQSQQQWGS